MDKSALPDYLWVFDMQFCEFPSSRTHRLRHYGAHLSQATKAVDMWTMRWRAPAAQHGQPWVHGCPHCAAFAHMPTASYYELEMNEDESQQPIQWGGLQGSDALRVAEVRHLQVHTSFGKDCPRRPG